MGEWMDEWMDKWMDEWMIGGIHEWMNEWVAEARDSIPSSGLSLKNANSCKEQTLS